MRLSVFAEFCSSKIIDQFSREFPNIQIDFPKNSTYSLNVKCSENSKEILRTNAKLFYEKNKDNISKILDYMIYLGFEITDDNPYIIITEQKEMIDQKTKKKKIIRVNNKKYYNDRIILTYKL